MSDKRSVATNSKYAWSAIPRAAPPKRPPEVRLGDFREIYANFDEAMVREQASRCIQCPHPRCMTGCPLSNRIPEWLALAAQGEFIAAAAVSQTTSNFPEICSRVCPQERLCEGACILNTRTDPVAIGAVERFINEYAFAHQAVTATRAEANGFKVAVVGSGPGGLACADELAQRGYAVTVYESLLTPGGLLVNGIPEFKLEKRLVERRVSLLRQRGVAFRFGVRVGWDISLADLRRDFDAVFLGVGAQKPKPLEIAGAELRGVFQALPFLVQKNVGSAPGEEPVEIAGKSVVVLGGGDSAMDCLRTAVRCGVTRATCVYRRDLANMPGSRKEYANAIEEGARFEFLTNPVALLGDDNGAMRAVRCVRMELGAPDASGRRTPRVMANSEFELPADVLLVAYGFDPMPFPVGSELAAIKAEKWGGLCVDENQMTSVPGVFSGGDSVRGPSLVVHAVRDARKAAEGIHKYLHGRVASREAGTG
jgi:glutamate synthase (NADPH/NADH) small chain